MQVVVKASALCELLRFAAPTQAIRRGAPPVSGVELETRGREKLLARGADAALQVEAAVEATVMEPGSVVVAPAEPLIQIAERLADSGELAIEVDMVTGSLKVQAVGKSGRYTLHGVRDSNTLPKFPGPGPDGVVVQAKVLREIARGVAVAADSEEKATRPDLAGVHLRIGGGRLLAEATDRVRIARLIVHIQHRPDLEMDFIVPAQAFRQAVRVLPGDGPVDLYLGHGVVVFEVLGGQQRVTVRLTDGQYPDIGRFIPEAFPVQFRTETGNLVGALGRACTFEEKGSVPVTVHVSSAGLHLAFQQPERGEGKELVVGIVTLQDGVGEARHRFNAPLLLEGLQAVPGQEVVFELGGGSMNLGRVRPFEPGEGGAEYQYLLLPLLDQ